MRIPGDELIADAGVTLSLNHLYPTSDGYKTAGRPMAHADMLTPPVDQNRYDNNIW